SLRQTGGGIRIRETMSRNDGGGEPSKSVLVRNLSYRSRPEDIRYAFEKFGDVRDVYMPRDYQTG
ncbi:unnamed protein product, partial [Heterosigma akashiwo]